MKYKIVGYTIRLNDGRERKGIAPYLGESVEPEEIKTFISEKIFELDGSFEEIAIDVVYRHIDEHEWIISVHQLELFRLLYWKEGFGKELLDKYKLPAPAPLTRFQEKAGDE
jgi:hypothetical protein